jgi:hypothetical protein
LGERACECATVCVCGFGCSSVCHLQLISAVGVALRDMLFLVLSSLLLLFQSRVIEIVISDGLQADPRTALIPSEQAVLDDDLPVPSLLHICFFSFWGGVCSNGMREEIGSANSPNE